MDRRIESKLEEGSEKMNLQEVKVSKKIEEEDLEKGGRELMLSLFHDREIRNGIASRFHNFDSQEFYNHFPPKNSKQVKEHESFLPNLLNIIKEEHERLCQTTEMDSESVKRLYHINKWKREEKRNSNIVYSPFFNESNSTYSPSNRQDFFRLPSSSPSIEQMKEIKIHEMKSNINKIVINRKIGLKIYTSSNDQSSGIESVVFDRDDRSVSSSTPPSKNAIFLASDDDGDFIQLYIFDICQELFHRLVKNKNEHFYIIHPFCKIGYDDGSLIIRVDFPARSIIFKSSDEKTIERNGSNSSISTAPEQQRRHYNNNILSSFLFRDMESLFVENSNNLCLYNAGCRIKYISPKKGRGMFAAKNFRVGDTILVSLPIVSISGRRRTSNNNNNNYDNYYLENEKYIETEEILLRRKLILLLSTSSGRSVERKIRLLSDGERRNVSTTTTSTSDEKKKNIFDLTTLFNIIRTNSYDIPESFENDLFNWFYDDQNNNNNNNSTFLGRGLYFLPSFFNHSCLPNCSYFVLCGGDQGGEENNMMVITSRKDIKIGEELDICYFNKLPEDGYQNRASRLQNLGVFCGPQCSLCSSGYDRDKNCDISEELISYISDTPIGDSKEFKLRIVRSLSDSVRRMNDRLYDGIFLVRFLVFIAYPILTSSVPRELQDDYFQLLMRVFEDGNHSVFFQVLIGKICWNQSVDKSILLSLIRKYKVRLWDIFRRVLGNRSKKLFYVWVREECAVCRKVWRLETPLFACSRCKKKFYCGTKCQRRDWKGHRGDCIVVDRRMKKKKK